MNRQSIKINNINRNELEMRGKCLNAMIDCIDDMFSSKKVLDDKTRKQYFSMRQELNRVNLALISSDYPELYEQMIIKGYY